MKTINSIPMNQPYLCRVLQRLIIIPILLFITSFSNAQCYKAFKYALGTSGADAAYDIVSAGGDNFFVIGTTVENSTGKNVIVTKMNSGGTIFWSKMYGGLGTEVVRKATRTKDNGLLITGSTSSLTNSKGDIMCLKLNTDGDLLWSKKFGLNSANGDLGMDIIETSEGGYAVAGILNATASNADMVIMMLDEYGNPVWIKRFNNGQKENGISLAENENSLIVTADIQNPDSDADGVVMEIDKKNGAVLKAIKLHPIIGGLTNPYISKDVNGGYWIKGHLTDKKQPSKMLQVILRLDTDFNITKSYKLVIPEYSNNNFSGFEAINDGFIACSGMESRSSGFVFRVRNDGGVAFAKKLVGGNDRKLNSLRLIGDKIIAVGSDNRKGNDEMFIIAFDSSGSAEPPCQTDTADLTIQAQAFSQIPFTWLATTNISFTNTNTSFETNTKVLNQTVLCSIDCTVPVYLHADFTLPDTVCVGTSVHVANTTIGGTTFNWSFNKNIINNTPNIPTATDSVPSPVIYSIPGVYTVSLVVNQGLPTQIEVSKNITVLASPVKSALFDSSFCAGDSVVLKTMFSPGAFEWNDGSRNSILIVKESGIRWVEVNYYGCVVRDSFNIHQNMLPALDLGADTIICEVSSLLLNAGNPGATYLWQDGSASQTFNVTHSGIYRVKVTDVNGCIAMDSVKLNLFTSMQLKVSDDTTICAGNPVQILASGKNIKSYSWLPAVTLSEDTISNPIVIPYTTTVYTVNATDMNGCKGRDSVRVTVLPSPFVITIEDSTICAGNRIKLSTIATTGVNYTWGPSNGLSNIYEGGVIAMPLTTTKYFVTVTASNGCTASDSVDVIVNPSPALVAATMDTLICFGKSAFLAATSSSAVSYKWYPSINMNDAASATPIVKPSVTTNYIVEATGSNGCITYDSVLVTVKPKPVFAVDPPVITVCAGKSVELMARGGDTYQWSPSGTLSGIMGPIVTATPLSSTSYKVVITDTDCAITDSVVATVNISGSSVIDITKSNDIDCMLASSTLKATGGIKYKWSPANSLSDVNIANPIATPLVTTTYRVEVTNAGGCTTTDSITVHVYKGIVENGYQLPTAFTPNSDGNNDCFGIRKWGPVTNLNFNIYNRSGHLIFHTNNASDCWDGTYKGVKQAYGTYIYHIKANAACGSVDRKGTIVLVR